MEDNRIDNQQTHEIITPDEILPPTATVIGHEALPHGFTPREPVPVGFILNAVLTNSELADYRANSNFTKQSRKLRYRYGRDSIFTTLNSQLPDQPSQDRIAIAEFIRYNAKPLPLTNRIKRAVSRTVFGIKCDVNF